ncbi:conserved Plasmodium protein, unknown function [Plasmodium ovale]|uniref:Uncharacterized protein n=2 Tax=Plasmodium ovale TaxID=36330 RepID=A0A1C3KRS4_PLAOA|nr:conserved Plasmodium protein, unknown function [Plasmodium ovale]
MCVRGSLSEGAQNTELYLTRTKQAYNFLEDSLNALDGKTPVQENVKQRISTIDLATAHNALLKDLRFSKLKDIINIKKFVFEGIMQMVMHMLQSLPTILEEVLTQSEFCTSIEAHFSFLYEIDETYENKIKACNEETRETIIFNYFFLYLQDSSNVVENFKEEPGAIFRRLGYIENCLEEFYKKVTSSFHEYLQETELYKDFIKNYERPIDAQNNVNYVEIFLKRFDKNLGKKEIIDFFEELNYHYSINNSHIPCFETF